MVITDYYSDCYEETSVGIGMGTVSTTIFFANEYDEYVEPVIKSIKKDPFWAKQGKNKKGGKSRYVRNSRV